MRHEKFSSIGRDLTEEINNGKTYKTNRKITSIAVHCIFSPMSANHTVHDVDNWHKERWGSGIGYHYFVDKKGKVYKGRWVDYPGAGVKGFNAHSIQIAREGGMRKDGTAIEDATPEQYKAIQKLTRLLISDDMYKLLPSDIKGHNEYKGSNKACPLLNMNIIRNIII